MDLLKIISQHFDTLVLKGAAHLGRVPLGFWPASMDPRTGRVDEADRPGPAPGRGSLLAVVAPGGSTVYRDLPSLAAAHHLSRCTGQPRWAVAADACVRALLARCVARSGLILWGNHYYWDPRAGCVIGQADEEDEPAPVEPHLSEGELHELRPVRVPWVLLQRISPNRTDCCIRRMGERHVVDANCGAFNRLATGLAGQATLASGGILVESLAWLAGASEDDEPALVELARRVAGFSFAHRGESTGLLCVEPLGEQWTSRCSTTEVGLWARCLLTASQSPGLEDLADLAAKACEAYLAHGFDDQAGTYFGKLDVTDGSCVCDEETSPAGPGEHADLWTAPSLAHDHPLSLGGACVELYRRTGKACFGLGIQRFARWVTASSPPEQALAGHLGRAIDLLLDAADALGDPSFADAARALADKAVSTLYAHGMFKGRADGECYRADDGVGYLLLALLRLRTGRVADYPGMRF
jgi:hypothetical protein